jgi:hypothetical protein
MKLLPSSFFTNDMSMNRSGLFLRLRRRENRAAKAREVVSFLFPCVRREAGATLTLLPAYPYTAEQILKQV